MKTKKCTKCGIEKSLDAEHYHRDSSRSSGFQSSCKVCKLQYHAERYQNNKEKILKQQAEHRSRPEIKKRKAEYDAERNSRPEIKKRKAEYDAEYHQNNKEKILKQTTEYRSQRKAKQPACVYKIVNTVNGKIYIGQTTRGELRWKGHLKDLRNGKTGRWNPNFQEDFNKFGENAFEWSIIEEYPKDREVLLLEEARTIVKYRKEGKDLYNLTLTIDQVQMLKENK